MRVNTKSKIRRVFISLAIAIVMLTGSVSTLIAQEDSARIPAVNNTNNTAMGMSSFGAVAAGVTTASATDLALAMGVPADDIVSADLMGSDPDGAGVSDESLGDWFPTASGTFAILATGKAADASLPNDSESHTSVLTGLDNSQGNDLVRLHLQLDVPDVANCLAFDFAFYSEEFEEWVNSQYNDAFTAQLKDSSLSIVTDTDVSPFPFVVAPGNFAFDENSNFIDVNTVFGVTTATGTTYDGVTPLLRAKTAVTGGSVIDLYLSIQDLGDSLWDSAVFLDNFFWSSDVDCVADTLADTDSDGLLDVWETDGLTLNGEFVDLPAMGADPEHKDIFVEIDWMGAETAGGHTHKPQGAAIALIVDAFDNAPVDNPDGSTGIHLHVDYGSDAPLTWGTAATWGALSDGDELAHQEELTNCAAGFSWTDFNTIMDANFLPAREAIFHYNLWIHDICPQWGGTSGVAGVNHNKLIVSLGSWNGSTGTVNQQAGTFMHELGHNLGLWHGGEDGVNYKPNYLSVMSYAFQTGGLIINGTQGNFDYSRYELPSLDENDLDEPSGIGLPALTDTLGTFYYCTTGGSSIDTDASAVDWNCDGDETDLGVAGDINNSGANILNSFNDWNNISYTGGTIGLPGIIVELPDPVILDDIEYVEALEIPQLTEFELSQDSINCKAQNGVVPFTIYSTAEFDAMTIDHNTVTLAGGSETHINKKTGEAKRHEDDVNGDGLMDLVFHVRLKDTTLCSAGGDMLVLTAETYEGQHLYGTDSIGVDNAESSLSETGTTSLSVAGSNSCSASFDGTSIYTPDVHLTTVFSVPSAYLTNGILDLNGDGLADTLGDALNYNSSSVIAVALRMSVNGLLYAEHSSIAYPLSWYQVVAEFNAAAAHGKGNSSAKLTRLIETLGAYHATYVPVGVESDC